MRVEFFKTTPLIKDIDLLEAPLWFAEESVVNLLNEKTDQTSIFKIKETGAYLASQFKKIVMPDTILDTSLIDLSLNEVLRHFYRSILPVLPDSTKEQLNENMELFQFSTQVILDWPGLVSKFMGAADWFAKEYEDELPDSVFRDLIKMQFMMTIRLLIKAGVSHDEKLVDLCIEQLLRDVNRTIIHKHDLDWVYFSRPPFKISTVKPTFGITPIKFSIDSNLDVQFKDDVMHDKFLNSIQCDIRIEEIKSTQMSTDSPDGQEYLSNSDLVCQIVIDNNQIASISSALQRHVKEEHKSNLNTLLAGEGIFEPIVINDRPSNSLAYIFLQAFNKGYIHNDKSEIMRWLIHYFRVTRKDPVSGQNKRYPITVSSIIDVFYKKQKPSNKKRIDYKP